MVTESFDVTKPCQVATLTTDAKDWWASILHEAARGRGPLGSDQHAAP